MTFSNSAPTVLALSLSKLLGISSVGVSPALGSGKGMWGVRKTVIETMCSRI